MSKGEEMKKHTFLIFCLILFLFSGCTYYVFNSHPDLTQDVKAKENEVSKDDIRLMAKCIHLKSEMKTYFDRDLVEYGIFPVQIYCIQQVCLLNQHKNHNIPKTALKNRVNNYS